MSWHSSQLSYALGIGGLFSFYGVVSMIVYLFPAAGVSSTQRIIIIALVLLTLPFALLIGFVASRRKKKKALAESSESSPTFSTPAVATQPETSGRVGSYDSIERGLDELVQFLKTSNLGDGGKESVYSLPWYIVAGAPRSGKSSLLIGSNLNFQVLPSQRQSEIKFIRPTADVDWRVTSDAVFLDTAGRYQTEEMGSDEWNSLLEGIRKRRPQRPLDGFILVLNAENTLKSDERENDEIAKVLRSRLDEAMKRLNVKFPVYVVFSNSDGIEGCRDSFSISKNEGKALVWGSTIPLEKSANAQAEFDPEFELLQNSVMKRRIARLSAPFPPVRQLRIFNFPLHFGSARRKIGSLISTLFRPSPFSDSPFLRGFYFTASIPTKSSPNAPTTVADSYFSERLFRDVILRDKDLVKTTIAQAQKAPLAGWLITFVGAFIVTALIALSLVSFFSNRTLLDEARTRGEKLIAITKTEAYKDPSKSDERSMRNEMLATDELRELLERLDDYERNGAPWYMRLGFYSGNRVYKRHLLKTYMSVVENRFKAVTVKKVEADLKKFADSNPVANPGKLTEQEEQVLGKNYDLLKAYLMLTGEFKARATSAHLASVLKDYWASESKIPADQKNVALKQLDFWAKQVDRDDEEYEFPRIQPDSKIVADARKKLQSFPASLRYYKGKVTEISKLIEDKIGPMSLADLLARNNSDTSLMAGTYKVRGAYTKPGLPLMKQALADADKQLSEGDWVMGETGKKEISQTTDSKELEKIYYRDYASEWQSFVKGVSVKPYKMETAAAALQTFSSPNSPMKILMTEISKNTNLSAKPEVQTLWDWIMSFFVRSNTDDTGGTTQPEIDFKPLFQFVGKKEEKEGAAIEKYGAAIGTLQKAFAGLKEDKLKQIAIDLATEKDDTLKIRATETTISNLIQTFSQTSSSQELAQLLQQPIGNLKTLLGADAKTQISKTWSEQIVPAAKDVEKGYPFEDGATDADLTKLTAYLNPVDGKLSKFYDDSLKKYFEEANGQLKVKENAELKFSDEFVAYLNNAFKLRTAIFGTEAKPKFGYAFTLKAGKELLIDITIDGQKLSTEGTMSLNGTFPAAQSAETGVIITSGSTAPPPPSTPAPTNSNTSSPAKTSTGSDGPTPLKFPGTWGFFRFIDAGKPSKQSGGDYALSYTVGGKSISASVKPNGGDPFDKSLFRQFRAPQSFIK